MIYLYGEDDFPGENGVSRELNGRLVRVCRKAFQEKYAGYWIDPVWYDGRRVGARLYPKTRSFVDFLKAEGLKVPESRRDWKRYGTLAWVFAQSCISASAEQGVEPIYVVVDGSSVKEVTGSWTRCTFLEERNTVECKN